MPAMQTPQTPQTVPQHPGEVVRQGSGYRSTLVTGSAPTSQVWRIALSGTSASEVSVTVTDGGDTHTVTTTFAGSVDATNATALAAALKDDPIFAGFFSSLEVASSTNVDLTGLNADDVIVTVNGTGLSVSETQAPAEDVALGYGKVYPIGGTTEESYLSGTASGTLAVLAGPVITFTATHNDSGDDYDITAILGSPTGTIERVVLSSSVGADLAAYLVQLESDLEGAVPGSTGTASSPDVAWALPVGWTVISVTTAADNSSDLTNVVTSAGDDPPARKTLGIARNSFTDEFADFAGTYVTERRASRGVILAREDCDISVVVADAIAPTVGDDVWVETATGATKYLCYDTPAPSRFLLAGAEFVSAADSNRAIVRL